MKHCGKCDQTKPLDEFNRHAGRKDGRAIWCRLCMRAYAKEHYARNTTAKKASTTRRRRARVRDGSTTEREYTAAYNRRRSGDLDWEMSRRLSGLKKERRRRRGVTITVDDLVALYLAQEGRCALTGRVMKLRGVGGIKDPCVMSIDRRDNTTGYHPDNVRLVVWAVNLALSSWGTAHLLALARDLITTQEGVYAAVS